MLFTGNIVKWHDSIWIVGDDCEKDSMILIAADSSNHMAHPSTTWPKDESLRIGSVKLIADNMFDFIKKSMTHMGEQIGTKE